MAAIPPFHEEPPVGTNNEGPVPAEEQERRASRPVSQETPPIKEGPDLPSGWSPVDPAPSQDVPARR